MLWLIAMHIIFDHLNAKNDFELYKLWMKLTFEMPRQNERYWRLAGVSRTENRTFWLTQNRFNYYFHRVLYASLIAFSFLYNLMFLKVSFEVDIYTKIFFQTINIVHCTFLVFHFLPQIYVVSVFVNMNLMRFFAKRFLCMRQKVERLAATSPISNRKLVRLIRDHHRIQFELIKMNKMFSSYLGVNFSCFCAISVFATFNLINDTIDWKVKIYMYAVTLGMYLTAIAIPFTSANSITTAVRLILYFLDWFGF